MIDTAKQLQLDSSGNLKTTGGGGGGGGAVTIADGADVTLGAKADAAITNPALSATEIALLKGLLTLLQKGTQNAANSLSVVLASDQATIPVETNLELAQGSTTAGEAGPLIQGATTTAAPSYTTAKTNPLSLTTLGGLRAALAEINGAAPGNTNPLDTRYASQSGYVALTTPPTQANAGSDTACTFSSQVNTVVIQNNTGATVGVAFDVTSSAGSLQLAAGQILIYSKKITVVHLFTAAAQNINGTSAGNIVLLGEL